MEQNASIMSLNNKAKNDGARFEELPASYAFTVQHDRKPSPASIRKIKEAEALFATVVNLEVTTGIRKYH